MPFVLALGYWMQTSASVIASAEPPMQVAMSSSVLMDCEHISGQTSHQGGFTLHLRAAIVTFASAAAIKA